MVRLTVRYCSAVSGVDFFVFLYHISRMLLVIHGWIFFPLFAKYLYGCFLYNSLDFVGQNFYVFFEKSLSCEFAAYSSLKKIISLSRCQIEYVGFPGDAFSSA